jgi:4-hydroxy-tetrahydrodipicolinate reductase
MIKAVLNGALGRMGGMVAEEISSSEDIELTGAVESPARAAEGAMICGVEVTADLARLAGGADVVVDFTTPEAAAAALSICASSKTPFITGTTRLPQAFLDAAAEAAAIIPVIVSPNMSAGVNLMFSTMETVTRALPDFDIEIVEIHHNRKKDSPSGTAARLASIARDIREGSRLVHGREGMIGERPREEIGVHSLRGGDVTGEHTVVFASDGERFELTHRAHSRMTFARGAIKAIRFIAGRGPGLYTMSDVLGL